METETVGITAVIRRMRGPSRSYLVQADDGHVYVLKSAVSSQEMQRAINEWVVSNLLRLFGICTPVIRALDVSKRCAMENNLKDPPPLHGIHFGSRMAADPTKVTVFDFVPRALHSSIRNRGDFVRTALLDLLVGKQDSRQAVFSRITGTKEFVANMIDNKSAFSGQLVTSGGQYDVRHFDRNLYDFDGAEEIAKQFYIELANAPWSDFKRCLQNMPEPWLAAETERDIQEVLRRSWESRNGISHKFWSLRYASQGTQSDAQIECFKMTAALRSILNPEPLGLASALPIATA